MALDRERSGIETLQLNEHARACESCSAELAATANMRSIISSVSSVTPAPADPGALTAGILTAISQFRRPRSRPLLDRFIRLTSAAVFRFSYTVIVVFSIGFFALTEFRSFTDLSRLEERMNRESRFGSPRVSYTISRESIAAVLPADVIQMVSGSSGETVTMNRRTLEQGVDRLERAGFHSYRLPTGIAASRPVGEAVDVLTKALFPKIRFVHRSSDS